MLNCAGFVETVGTHAPALHWASDKETALTREKKKKNRAPAARRHDSAVMFKALSLSLLTLTFS